VYKTERRQTYLREAAVMDMMRRTSARGRPMGGGEIQAEARHEGQTLGGREAGGGGIKETVAFAEHVANAEAYHA
jgi:hypothetical protein